METKPPFRRRTDSMMPQRLGAGPLLRAMREAVRKKPMPAVMTRLMEEGRQGFVADAARTVRAALFKEAEVTQTLIRLLAGETPLGLPEAYRYYFGAMVDPERLRTFRSARDRVLRGHICVERRGEHIRMVPEGTVIGPEEDSVINAALVENRVLYFSNGRMYSADRRDLHGAIDTESLPAGTHSSRLVIPLDDHFGLIEVVGADLTFGNLIRRHEAAVTAAVDLSKILSLKYAAEIDGLTGLYNRRAFDYLLSFFVDEFVKGGPDLAVVMLDVDHFKRVNDTYGHPTGDEVLAMCAAAASATMRASDLLGRMNFPQDGVRNGREMARYGGEEFAILLPGVGNEGASIAARRCKDAVSSRRVDGPNGESISVTVSMGIASLSEAEGAASGEGFGDLAGKSALVRKAVMAMADSALYEAKASGRNGIVVASSGETQEGRGTKFTKL
ncbi:MAG: GGDEF domain-containing protein [Candidatus Micrarchaeota archaeon]